MNVSLAGSVVLELAQDGVSLVEYRWPRHVAWTDLPIIRNPAFKAQANMRLNLLDEAGLQDGGTRYQWDRDGSASPNLQAQLAAIIRSGRAIVFDLGHEPDVRTLADLGHLLDAYVEKEGQVPKVAWFDGTDVHNIAFRRVRDAQKASRAEHRFTWNYTLNTCLILRRAYLEALRQDPLGSELAQKAALGAHGVDVLDQTLRLFSSGSMCASPLALQMLHSLRLNAPAMKSCEVLAQEEHAFLPVGSKDSLRVRDASFYRGSGFFQMDGSGPNGDGGRFKWSGTGRYPAYFGSYHEELVRNCATNVIVPEFQTMQALEKAGLIVNEISGSVRITEMAERFLDLAGKKSKDLDVLLRWRSPSGFLGSVVDVPAMDRWMHDHFRCIKRRVQHLPDAGGLRRKLRRWEADGTFVQDMPQDFLPADEPDAGESGRTMHHHIIQGRVAFLSSSIVETDKILSAAIRHMEGMPSDESSTYDVPSFSL